MLALDDAEWGAINGGAHAVELLREFGTDVTSDAGWEGLCEAIFHQDCAMSVSYAILPHLAELISSMAPRDRLLQVEVAAEIAGQFLLRPTVDVAGRQVRVGDRGVPLSDPVLQGVEIARQRLRSLVAETLAACDWDRPTTLFILAALANVSHLPHDAYAIATFAGRAGLICHHCKTSLGPGHWATP